MNKNSAMFPPTLRECFFVRRNFRRAARGAYFPMLFTSSTAPFPVKIRRACSRILSCATAGSVRYVNLLMNLLTKCHETSISANKNTETADA
jgi:hypothetical protein